MELLSAGCLVVMIEITTSGGFGGLATGGAHTSASLSDLPTAQAATYCEAFAPTALAALAETETPQGRADTITYEIKVVDDDGAHQFQLDETQLPPEMLDLIDDLINR
ncbi:MAG: protealysin inhibitor emfourin [Sulfitobacter sp.]